ncbi:alpha/beta hydrolase [Hoeflea prorocentri]|uniref:Alpha/beta hydrolase n=1 Tax=Hoeflea prorocentri TaxID=1922333 RepID=A0A9X3UH43_9HYPH|nr:alpha/beta hydrolase [Hoeflea prorocentri]MCY6380544.1 alpha/beta hydrolase [Hoeflea prorocentri]MDA5398344.1 alpha/beta hydrolase [Hoeflea prorocentri]
MAKRFKRRRLVYLILLLICAAAIIFYIGPRTAVSTQIRFDPAAIGDDVEAYLDRVEARYSDIREGLGKQIVWAYPNSRARTPVSLVYIHGFSASSGEIRPVMDIVARDLGANLYYTRLAGHGRSSDAMGEATVEAWVNDVAEAIAVGRELGEKVVLVGTSTGGTLISWAATQPGLTDDVAGIVNISPNFGVNAAGSFLLTIPWAKQVLGLVMGERRSFETVNDYHRHNWTYEYPSQALLPMAKIVRITREADLGQADIPALFIYSPDDRIVRAEETEIIAATWGADVRTVLIEESDDKDNHVVAGDALSPSNTQRVADAIAEWIGQLPESR